MCSWWRGSRARPTSSLPRCVLQYRYDILSHKFTLDSFWEADADDLGAAKATLTGLRKRHAQSGVAPIFINTVSAAS
jgi:hypothetical protein